MKARNLESEKMAAVIFSLSASKGGFAMKKASHGFTLVEVLVAMLCGTLVLGMVTGAVVFLTGATDKLLREGRTLHRTKAVYDYICSLQLNDDKSANEEFSVECGSLKRNGIEVLWVEGLEEIVFSSKDGFVYCNLLYADRAAFSFVAGKESTS